MGGRYGGPGTDGGGGVTPSETKTVLALAREGSLPETTVGRAWRLLRADLMGYLHGDRRRQAEAVDS